MNELVVSRYSSDPASDKFDYLRKMKLKSFKELETKYLEGSHQRSCTAIKKLSSLVWKNGVT